MEIGERGLSFEWQYAGVCQLSTSLFSPACWGWYKFLMDHTRPLRLYDGCSWGRCVRACVKGMLGAGQTCLPAPNCPILSGHWISSVRAMFIQWGVEPRHSMSWPRCCHSAVCVDTYIYHPPVCVICLCCVSMQWKAAVQNDHPTSCSFPHCSVKLFPVLWLQK